RAEVVIASKGGIHRVGNGQAIDGSRDNLLRECDESLLRLQTDRIDLYYLHAPDPTLPIEESASAIAELIAAGKVKTAGASNVSLQQIQSFHEVCPLTAIQPAYNMLQREIETEIVPWCVRENVAICVYWPLLKGLLAGRLPRDHVFQEGDGRKKYPMFQGEEWQRNQDLLDDLRAIADASGLTIAQLSIAWTIAQPGITSALCGAKRPWQIEETAAAMQVALSTDVQEGIQRALIRRGVPASRPAV
ncbi:MAG: aldo/keto reductase, partial [Planctomycetaceae bacterium]|nr:aldo/keto reductase [Planctomycetaceae bacterium]